MFKDNFLVIALLVIIVTIISLVYILPNPIFEQMLSIFGGNSNFNYNQDFVLSSEAYRIGQVGRPMANGSRDLSLI